MGRPQVIGLTGGFATGKTTVARMLKRLGARIVDCDRIAHQALNKGTPTYRKIVREFSAQAICDRQGRIDRIKLGALVFRSPAKRKRLENVIHPFVFRELDRVIRKTRKKVVVLEVPLLFETGFDKKVDCTAVVSAPRRVQIERAQKKFKWSPLEIESRIRAQWPLTEKEAKADFIIHNGRSWAETAAQVRQVWEKWKQITLQKKENPRKEV